MEKLNLKELRGDIILTLKDCDSYDEESAELNYMLGRTQAFIELGVSEDNLSEDEVGELKELHQILREKLWNE